VQPDYSAATSSVNRSRALIAVDSSPRLTAQALNLRPGANAPEEITVVMVTGVARNLLRRSNPPIVVVPEFGTVPQ
jgi:hypothetical protein